MNPHTRKLLWLSAHPGSPPIWFLPLWATVCGAMAAVAEPLTMIGIARLLLALFLVELGWGELWLALTATDWATPLERWRHWEAQDPSRTINLALHIPYARPGSPADRLTRWLAQLTSWGQTVFLPAAGAALRSGLVGLLFSLALSAVLGRDFLLLTLGILASAQLVAVASGGHGGAGPGAGLAFRVGLGWLAGHLTFASLTLPSVALAGAFSLAASGAEINRNRKINRKINLALHWAFWVGGYLGAMLLLVVLRRPLVVPFIAFLALPPLLADAPEGASGWLRRYGVWLAAAMLLAAISAR